jgi:hypothetical protein
LETLSPLFSLLAPFLVREIAKNFSEKIWQRNASQEKRMGGSKRMGGPSDAGIPASTALNRPPLCLKGDSPN